MADLRLVTFTFWAYFSVCKKRHWTKSPPYVAIQTFSDLSLGVILLQACFPLSLMTPVNFTDLYYGRFQDKTLWPCVFYFPLEKIVHLVSSRSWKQGVLAIKTWLRPDGGRQLVQTCPEVGIGCVPFSSSETGWRSCVYEHMWVCACFYPRNQLKVQSL